MSRRVPAAQAFAPSFGITFSAARPPPPASVRRCRRLDRRTPRSRRPPHSPQLGRGRREAAGASSRTRWAATRSKRRHGARARNVDFGAPLIVLRSRRPPALASAARRAARPRQGATAPTPQRSRKRVAGRGLEHAADEFRGPTIYIASAPSRLPRARARGLTTDHRRLRRCLRLRRPSCCGRLAQRRRRAGSRHDLR